MLSKILEICINKPDGAELNEIARRLNKNPMVVEGMIDQLVRMGKLVELREYPMCKMCPTQSSCILLKSSERLFCVSMNAVQDDNLDCQKLHTLDRGSEIDSA